MGLTRGQQLRGFFGFVVHSCPEEGRIMLDDFLGDQESPIRQACAEQVAKLAKFCKGADCEGEEGYELIISTLLPVCAQLLEDDKAEVCRQYQFLDEFSTSLQQRC